MEKNVTVYIPAYNAGGHIESCLAAILKQKYPVSEVIVVDDGSTDHTVELCRRFPVKLVRHPVNLGLAAARNTAIRNAKGEFIAAVDSDCAPDPRWLEQLMEHFDADNIAGVGGRLFEDHRGSGTGLWRAERMSQQWGEDTGNPPFLFGSNTVFRKSALEEVNLYKESYMTNYEDVDVSRRIKAFGFELHYAPGAQVLHMRRDSVISLFRNFWNWNFFYYEEKGFYEDFSKIKNKIFDNAGYANRLVRKDIQTGKLGLLYYDFIMYFFISLLDLMFFFNSFRQQLCNKEFSVLCGYLSLADFSLFHVADHAQGRNRSLMRKQFTLQQNLYVMIVVVINLLMHKKIDRRICKHLTKELLSVFCYHNQNIDILTQTILNLAQRKQGLEDFLKKPHQNIEEEVRSSLARSFYGIYGRLFHDNKDLNGLLLKSFEMNEVTT